MKDLEMEKVLSLCKRRGIAFAGSEIYGGLANTWDYGPLGVELKNQIKQLWWKNFVHQRADVVGLDGSILTNAKIWEASGHTQNFADPLMDCKKCKSRFRADKLLEQNYPELLAELAQLNQQQLEQKIVDLGIQCPNCQAKDFTKIRQFNLMFKTFQGVQEEAAALVYLRPETAQNIFVNFKNVHTTSRKKLPFGIAQIGKAFRNEITPGNFIFRTREFEQMELEYFCLQQDAAQHFEFWQDFCYQWLLDLGLQKNLLRCRKHENNELSHYSKSTSDLEFLFPFGWGELWGIAHRGNYDLSQHSKFSGKDLEYHDQDLAVLPDVIEPSLGVDRLLLAILCSAYHEEQVGAETRVILKLNPQIAPIFAAVLPLSKKLTPIAENVFKLLSSQFIVDYDDRGSIGRRYRRQDEVGTPFCITVDFETEQDQAVTVRFRDSMEQQRIAIDQLNQFLKQPEHPKK